MAKNGQKCSIIAKNDIKRSKMIKNGQKCKKSPKWPKMTKKWPNMAKKWQKMA